MNFVREDISVGRSAERAVPSPPCHCGTSDIRKPKSTAKSAHPRPRRSARRRLRSNLAN